MNYLRDRGFSIHKYAYALHLFLSMMLMVALRVLDIVPPIEAALIVAGIGLFKEFVIDAMIRQRQWDWKDLMMDGIGIAIGFLFTAGYYKLMSL